MKSAKTYPSKVFVSAGESSGDLYASALVGALRKDWPATHWFGCAGPRMQEAGVDCLVDARSLSVVGLVEVAHHLPRIYVKFRKLVNAIEREKPGLVILTDSPDFHLRIAAKVRKMGIPVIFLVAPQAWAWRQGRVKQMRRNISHLLCLFPFEEAFFRDRGVPTSYIGHPLARMIGARKSKEEFFRTHGLPADRPMVALCPGSRKGEVARHLPPVLDAVSRLRREVDASFVLAAPLGFGARNFFRERISASSIQIIEGETWDVLSHADLALTASGTVTMEAALLGIPMVTYYKVTRLSWLLGRLLVRVPHYSMVNLIAQRRLAPELMQNEMTGERLAREAMILLNEGKERDAMRRGLTEVAAMLSSDVDPIERAAGIVREFFHEHIRQG